MDVTKQARLAEIDAERQKIYEQIKDLEERNETLRGESAMLECPFKIGDLIEGISGRDKGKRFVVSGPMRGETFCVGMHPILKDGGEGKTERRLWLSDRGDYRKIEVAP